MLDTDPAAARAVDLSVFGKLPVSLRAPLFDDFRDVTVPPDHRYMGADQPAPYRTGLVSALVDSIDQFDDADLRTLLAALGPQPARVREQRAPRPRSR